MNGFPRKHLKLRPTDLVFIVLNLIFAGFSFAFIGRETSGLFGLSFDPQLVKGIVFLAAVPAVLLLVPVLDRFSVRRMERAVPGPLVWIRTFYPQLFYVLFFTQCIRLSQLLYGGRTFDGAVAGLEELVFGGRPVMAVFFEVPKLPVLNEIFFFGYLSFYLLITVSWWVMFLRGRDDAAKRGVFTVTFSFGLLYVWYMFFPVEGPKFYYETLHAAWYTPFEGPVFTPLIIGIFSIVNMAGAAFPSSHVAIGLLAVMLNIRENRRSAWIVVPPGLLLTGATIYLYTHYIVDVIAGAFLAVVFFLFVPRLWDMLERRRRGS